MTTAITQTQITYQSQYKLCKSCQEEVDRFARQVIEEAQEKGEISDKVKSVIIRESSIEDASGSTITLPDASRLEELKRQVQAIHKACDEAHPSPSPSDSSSSTASSTHTSKPAIPRLDLSQINRLSLK